MLTYKLFLCNIPHFLYGKSIPDAWKIALCLVANASTLRLFCVITDLGGKYKMFRLPLPFPYLLIPAGSPHPRATV